MSSKKALIDSARMEILIHDQAGARVDRIAVHARVNKRMIYHHFGSKDGVYRAVLQGQLALLSSELAPVPTSLKLVCGRYLSEFGKDLLDKPSSQTSEHSPNKEDYKIAAIICSRALLSLGGNSTAERSSTLNYIKALGTHERDELFTTLMGLIFDSDLDLSLVSRTKVVEPDADPELNKVHKVKRQMVAISRPT